MADFDDEVLATVRALSATVGVPEHLPGAAAEWSPFVAASWQPSR